MANKIERIAFPKHGSLTWSRHDKVASTRCDIPAESCEHTSSPQTGSHQDQQLCYMVLEIDLSSGLILCLGRLSNRISTNN